MNATCHSFDISCIPDTRDNGTVSSLDIQALLASRYGLHLSHTECIEILRGLGGGMSSDEVAMKEEMAIRYEEMARSLAQKKKIPRFRASKHQEDEANVKTKSLSLPSERDPATGERKSGNSDGVASADLREDADIPEEYLDLVQILGILIIPFLVQAADRFRKSQTGEATASDGAGEVKEGEESLQPQPSSLLHDVHTVLMRQLGPYESDAGTHALPLLDEKLIEDILIECGEYERVKNQDLLREMVQVAKSSSGRLDLEAFVQALTSDLDMWPLGSESKISTFFYDVFGQTRAQVNDAIAVGRIKVTSPNQDKDGDKEDGISDPEKDDALSGSFTKDNSIDHSNVDFVVDIHASVVAMVVIWFFYLMTTITYASIFQSLVSAPCVNDGRGDEFGCLLSSQLWNWCVARAMCRPTCVGSVGI